MSRKAFADALYWTVVFGAMGALALFAGGCSNPTAPDGMAEFAAKHAHEVCVLVSGQPVLMDLATQWNTFQVVPISQCDPRE